MWSCKPTSMQSFMSNLNVKDTANRGWNGADRFFWAPELDCFFAIKINGYLFLNNRRTKYWHSHSIKNKAGTYSAGCCKRFPVILILYILCPALVKICSSSQWRVKTVKNIFLAFFMIFFFEIKQILNIHPETGARVNEVYPPHGTCGEDSSPGG